MLRPSSGLCSLAVGGALASSRPHQASRQVRRLPPRRGSKRRTARWLVPARCSLQTANACRAGLNRAHASRPESRLRPDEELGSGRLGPSKQRQGDKCERCKQQCNDWPQAALGQVADPLVCRTLPALCSLIDQRVDEVDHDGSSFSLRLFEPYVRPCRSGVNQITPGETLVIFFEMLIGPNGQRPPGTIAAAATRPGKNSVALYREL
jgi:hypothetical protein